MVVVVVAGLPTAGPPPASLNEYDVYQVDFGGKAPEYQPLVPESTPPGSTLRLNSGDSFSFVDWARGRHTGGEFYVGVTSASSSFYANNFEQLGVVDLGDLGQIPLADVSPPDSGYSRHSVPIVTGHTYVALAQWGRIGFVVLRVVSVNTEEGSVDLESLYRPEPLALAVPIQPPTLQRCSFVFARLPGGSLFVSIYYPSLGKGARVWDYADGVAEFGLVIHDGKLVGGTTPPDYDCGGAEWIITYAGTGEGVLRETAPVSSLPDSFLDPLLAQ